jgi:carboxypeptidase T
MRKIIFWLFIIVLTPSFVFAEGRKMLVEVEIETPLDVLRLQKMDIDIASERVVPPIHVIVTDAQLEELKKNGWKVHILIEDLILRFKEEINVGGTLGDYHTYAEMVKEIKQVADMYPDIVRLEDIGDSWEKTQGIANRDIWAIKISDKPDSEEDAEPDVLIVGCHHARELITVEIPLAIIKTLTERYATDLRIKYLVDNREIWVVPMLNPDGHVYVEEVNPMWRKNRNTNNYDDPYYQGVDLNRNYSYKWGYDNIGSSLNVWSETYRGTAPFSEPETQSLRDFVEDKDFTVALSYHSYGNLFLFPWGYINEDTEDHEIFEKLGQVYCKQNGYVYGNAKDGIIYNTNGSMDDWMYGEQLTKNNIFGSTVEVGREFQPPSSEIPQLVEENLKPALWMIFLAGRLY